MLGPYSLREQAILLAALKRYADIEGSDGNLILDRLLRDLLGHVKRAPIDIGRPS